MKTKSKVKSHMPNVQLMIDTDPKFARVFAMAKANDLPRDLHAGYAYAYENNGLYDLGIATLMFGGQTWQEYLDDCEKDIADFIIGGKNPRIKELNLDMTKPFKGDKRKKPTDSKKPIAPSSNEVVTAKEGDAYRNEIRKLCEEMSWTLTESGGAILVEDEGTEVARATYRRGTKNNAWKNISTQLEVLT